MRVLNILMLLALSCAVSLSASSTFAIPRTINYQGLLVDDGTPVDGTKSVRFRIYDSAEDGDYLWEEVQSVTFSNGIFSVLLGSTETIPQAIFDGSRRWLSVSIDGGPEILPRGEMVSVGYAFRSASSDSASHADAAESAESASYAQDAGDADLLDGLDSSQFAGSGHTHDSRYYTRNQLNTSDGNPPNQGSNLVHWNILNGVPEGFADGVDNTGEPGTSDHGELTGLLDDDHPQYAQKDTLKTSDGTPPNQGSNLVHWDILTGVPQGFADGTDSITTDASLIISGTMDPERINGVAVVDSDPRLLTVAQKGELTGGDTTALHSHTEIGDISSVTAGEGLSGGGTTGEVTVSHAQDASSLPFAHQYPAIAAHSERASFESNSMVPVVVDSVTVETPADGFVYISFSGTQRLDIDLEGFPPVWVPKRYIARYGVGIDTTSAMTYFISSSMADSIYWAGGTYVPTRPIMGSTLRQISQGVHKIYFLTEMSLEIDSGADNNLENASLTAIYFPYDTASFQSAMLQSSFGRTEALDMEESGRILDE